MLEALLAVLICAVLLAGAYYAAHYVVHLRHNRDTIADELKRATDHIGEMESRVMMLEAERESRELRNGQLRTGEPQGWGAMDIRG